MDEKIELTPQELIDLKDEIKFRERVVLQLKQLNSIPNRVNKIEVKLFIQWFVISAIILGIFSLAFRVLAK